MAAELLWAAHLVAWSPAAPHCPRRSRQSMQSSDAPACTAVCSGLYLKSYLLRAGKFPSVLIRQGCVDCTSVLGDCAESMQCYLTVNGPNRLHVILYIVSILLASAAWKIKRHAHLILAISPSYVSFEKVLKNLKNLFLAFPPAVDSMPCQTCTCKSEVLSGGYLLTVLLVSRARLAKSSRTPLCWMKRVSSCQPPPISLGRVLSAISYDSLPLSM